MTEKFYSVRAGKTGCLAFTWGNWLVLRSYLSCAMVNKFSRMENFIGDWRVPVLRRESGTSLTIGAGSGTGRKSSEET